MKILQKISVALALFIGVMSIIAGSKVLLGVDVKEYNTMQWLIVYNVMMGIFSVVTAFFIYKYKSVSSKMIFAIFTMHILVFLSLFFVNEAAFQSKMAMLFRSAIWLVIIVFTQILPKYIKPKTIN